jgi:hypothetical protein
MTLFEQIFWGSTYLGICLILQMLFLGMAEYALARYGERLKRRRHLVRMVAIFVVSLAFIVTSHTMQVWVWAAAYVFSDVLPDWNTSVYFSLVTYTSLGYGDIVLPAAVRIFGAFAAVTGLLGFGISTAYLVSLLNRLPKGAPDQGGE